MDCPSDARLLGRAAIAASPPAPAAPLRAAMGEPIFLLPVSVCLRLEILLVPLRHNQPPVWLSSQRSVRKLEFMHVQALSAVHQQRRVAVLCSFVFVRLQVHPTLIALLLSPLCAAVYKTESRGRNEFWTSV